MKIIITLLLSLLLFTACSKPVKFVEERYQMATITQIQISARSDEAGKAKAAINTAFAAIDKLESVASWFIKTSDTAAISKAAPGQLVAVDPIMVKMIQKAQILSDITDGKFDITAGKIIRLWGFGPNSTNHIPSEQEIKVALSSCGMQKLVLLADQNAVSSVVAGVQCDVSALAAGMAADLAADQLLAAGFTNFLVNAGGEIRTSSTGKKEWSIGIQVPVPNAEAGLFLEDQVLRLKNSSLSTSGNYNKFFENGSNAYAHIVNPKTGRPVQSKTVSVTVLAEDCLTADGWSTALFCLPAKEAIKLAEAHNNIECLIVEAPYHNSSNFVFHTTKGF